MFGMISKDERRYDSLRTAAGVLAVLGAGIMGYLLRLHYAGGSGLCDFGQGFSCSAVNQSVYASLLGVPLSALGLMYFLTVAFLMFFRRVKGVFVWALLFSVFSLVFGVYLSAIEHFVLESVCLYCELTKVLMIGIIGISVVGSRDGSEDVPLEWIAWVVVLGFVFSYVAWMLQRVP